MYRIIHESLHGFKVVLRLPRQEGTSSQKEVPLAHCGFIGLEDEFLTLRENLGFGISIPFNRSNAGGRKCG